MTASSQTPVSNASNAPDEIAEHWINGAWVESDTVSDSINPATGEVLGQWEDGGEAEARAAVAAARRAFDNSSWARARNLRNQALLEMAAAVDAHAEELVRASPRTPRQSGGPIGTVWTNTMGGDQRRLRRGRLQAKRYRPASRPARNRRLPRNQVRRALYSASRSLNFRAAAVVASVLARPPDRVEDGDRIEIVTPSRNLAINDGDDGDVTVSVGSAAADNSALGGVLENDDPGFAVMMDVEIEAAVEKDRVAVGPI